LTSPAIELKPAQIGTGGLFDVYAKNVEKIENEMSIELNELNIEQYVPKTGNEAVGLIKQAEALPKQIEEGEKT
jgi:hypothetical protein